MKRKKRKIVTERNTEILTTREAAEYLGISYSYLRTLRATPGARKNVSPPPQIYIGQSQKSVRYLRSDLDAWLKSRPRYLVEESEKVCAENSAQRNFSRAP
ncbi:helix-turn-helix transcriptional regulator [Cloacibacillus porcorum]